MTKNVNIWYFPIVFLVLAFAHGLNFVVRNPKTDLIVKLFWNILRSSLMLVDAVAMVYVFVKVTKAIKDQPFLYNKATQSETSSLSKSEPSVAQRISRGLTGRKKSGGRSVHSDSNTHRLIAFSLPKQTAILSSCNNPGVVIEMKGHRRNYEEVDKGNIIHGNGINSDVSNTNENIAENINCGNRNKNDENGNKNQTTASNERIDSPSSKTEINKCNTNQPPGNSDNEHLDHTGRNISSNFPK